MSLYTYAPILQCVQDALVRLNQTKPIGVYDSSDDNAVILGSQANLIGPMLQDAFKWQQFRKQFSVTGDSIATAFTLPAGFSRFADNTGWSLANRRPVIIVNDVQWADIKAWVSQSFFINPACRIFDDKLQFLTAPAIGEEITFEYITHNWVIDADDPNLFKQVCNKNGDVPMHDSLLFTLALAVKWLETRGMPTQAMQQDFNERFLQITSRNQMAGMLSLNGAMTGFRYLNGANIPDTGFGPP
jgi:hypothetical protein